ncbi:hypothetical protein I5677_13435 [Mobilitalea sibirica]|uniref:Tetratricopeptide repeat protein n=1 Tax=Mobilitalea sibirica TaxID=1462919 RepID=A0A8J7HBW8_9FIRM|nr:hypothetical protein [Mobilitalea sibirica]MBH1941900.1 hypothetical protein [Mobilitalea sibirica]
MGSYEIIVKTEEIKKRVQEGDYTSAQIILDTLELKKVKNTSDMSLMAEVFIYNERYEEAYELLLKIYHKSKLRKVLYQLVWVCIKRKNTDDAIRYLEEYEKIAPKDFYKYILRYKIDKLLGKPYDVLIETLKTLKETEYMEQWAYELAKLYYKAGMEKECIKECSDIILWFGEGSYVEKARILKAYYLGEADKEEIIEGLKKRASEETHHSKTEENQEFGDSDKNSNEEELYQNRSDSDNAFEQETDKDEQNLMYEDHSFYVDDTNELNESILPESIKKDVRDIMASDLQKDMVGEGRSEEKQYNTGLVTNKELAELEVEDELYRLLEEENMDEDDLFLEKLSEDLSIELKEVFGNFLPVKAIKKQLVKSIEIILDQQTKTTLMIITGAAGSGKTTLAKDISVFLNRIGKLKSPKVAKISADSLNKIDLMQKKDALRDCCVVIEQASELKKPAIDKLLELIEYLDGEIAVVFEENKKNMNKLFRECPKLMDLFKNRIHLPSYTKEDLLRIVYAGFRLQEYRLHPQTQTVIRDLVYEITNQMKPEIQLYKIQQLIMSSISASDQRLGKQLTSLVTEGRLGEANLQWIYPEDLPVTL